MEAIKNEDIIKIDMAFDYCKKMDFQSAYDIVIECVKEYRIHFFPIICLNLEKYREGSNYKLILSNDKLPLVKKGGDKFIQKCDAALELCSYADQTEKQLGVWLNARYTPNESIDIKEYMRIMENIALYCDSGDFKKVKEYIEETFYITSWDYTVWYQYVQAVIKELSGDNLEKLVNPCTIKAFVPLKKAIELSEQQETNDFDMHFMMIQIMFALKTFGLEMPKLLAKEFENLKLSATDYIEKANVEQLEANAYSINKLFPFIDEEISDYLRELRDLFKREASDILIKDERLNIIMPKGFIRENFITFMEDDKTIKMDLLAEFGDEKTVKEIYGSLRYMELETGVFIFHNYQKTMCETDDMTYIIKFSREFAKEDFSVHTIYKEIKELIDLPSKCLESIESSTTKNNSNYRSSSKICNSSLSSSKISNSRLSRPKIDKGCLLGVLSLLYPIIVIIIAIIIGST